MIIVLKGNIVIDFGISIDDSFENGIKLFDNKGNSFIYPNEFGITVTEVQEVPPEINKQEYCYDKIKGFYKNPDYLPYVSTEEQLVIAKEKITLLEQSQALMKKALDDLAMGV